ncbi:MAG: CARDB domain-containing protein, partial [Bacteroidota bacterium]
MSALFTHLQKLILTTSLLSFFHLASAQPDLVIQNESSNLSQANAGDQIILDCDVANIGSTQAPSSSLRLYLSTDAQYDGADVLLGSKWVGKIDPGADRDKSFTGNIPAATANGAYFILFRADAKEKIAEANESNNVAAIALQVGSTPNPPANLPDLFLEEPKAIGLTTNSVSPARIAAGASAKFSVNVVNYAGLVDTTTSVDIFLSTDPSFDNTDLYLGDKNIFWPGAPGNITKTLITSVPANLTDGIYYVLYHIDPDGIVAEKDESNNWTYCEVTVGNGSGNLPDLSPVQLQLKQIRYGANYVKGRLEFVEYNAGSAGTGLHNNQINVYVSSDKFLDPGDVLLSSVNAN